MNNTPLTEKIQAVILTTQDYARFLRHYHMSVLGNENYDWWHETEKLYNSMRDVLPEGMNTSLVCFEAVMSYKIDETTDTLFEELPKKFRFSF